MRKSLRILSTLLLALVSTGHLAYRYCDDAMDAADSAPEFVSFQYGQQTGSSLFFNQADDDDGVPPLTSTALPSPQDQLRSALPAGSAGAAAAFFAALPAMCLELPPQIEAGAGLDPPPRARTFTPYSCRSLAPPLA